jgi:hypothetical protein
MHITSDFMAMTPLQSSHAQRIAGGQLVGFTWTYYAYVLSSFRFIDCEVCQYEPDVSLNSGK